MKLFLLKPPLYHEAAAKDLVPKNVSSVTDLRCPLRMTLMARGWQEGFRHRLEIADLALCGGPIYLNLKFEISNSLPDKSQSAIRIANRKSAIYISPPPLRVFSVLV